MMSTYIISTLLNLYRQGHQDDSSSTGANVEPKGRLGGSMRTGSEGETHGIVGCKGRTTGTDGYQRLQKDAILWEASIFEC